MIKVNLKSILGLAALGMTLLANTVPTWAGSVGTPEVSITRATTYIAARGSMVGARYSADGRQYIGCSLTSAPGVQCAAQDSADNFAYCVSTDARHVDAVQRMIDSSHINFELDTGDPACINIRIYNNSGYLK
jgi:hypothetical protein